jgi:DNA-binding transcriptional LysR family regulator
MAPLPRLEAFDLNLLVALDHLLATASVTEAARRAGTTQPAMSRTLARLRAALGDPLLVPAGRALAPTTRATALRPRVRDALAAARRVFEPTAELGPGQGRATVRVAATDYATLVLLGPWLQRLRVDAPGIDVHIEPLGLATIRRLVDGETAFALAPPVRLAGIDGLVTRTLLRDRYVSVLRKDHPRARNGLDARTFAALDHLQIVTDVPGPGAVSKALAQRGLERRVAVTVPSYLLATALVATTDLVATLPARLLRATDAALRAYPTPLDLKPLRVSLVWHAQWTADPRHRWLRERLRATAREIDVEELE